MAKLDKAAVKRANPIERVIPELLHEQPVESGPDLKVRCPFHQDGKPSLRINPEKQVWHCDPCGFGGDVIAFVERYEQVDFQTALARLAERAGMPKGDTRREVAAYDYRDEAGTLLYQSVRFEPKDFKQRRPNGQGGWIWNLHGTRRVAYRLPELKGREAIYIAEGEKDVDALWSLTPAIPATCNVGGASENGKKPKWRNEYARQLSAQGVKRVAVIGDNDEAGCAHAEAVARSCHAADIEVRLVGALPDVPPKGDVSDYLRIHTRAELIALVKSTAAYIPAPVGSIASEEAAGTLARRTPKAVEKRSKQGREVQLEDPELWADPVDGARLLDAIAETFERYLALPAHASTALALWVLHAFAFAAWFTSPFLAVSSPAKRCGKTLLLIVLGALVPRRLFASNVTPAVLFRTIEKYEPTLLIDEADTFVRDNDELRGVLNSGHTRTTAVAIRAVGDDHEPRAFSTWCPKAIALIGKLPGTLADRAIEIRMRRRTTGERVQPLRQDRIEAECSDLRRQAARWVDDHLSQLQEIDPHVPALGNDRAADCWRPLLAIAEAAGANWPTQAREAALALSGEPTEDDAMTALLRDIRDIFAADGDSDVLASSVLVERLVGLEDRPWKEWSNGRPLSPAKLARLLAGYDVHSAGNVRIGAKVLKGYRRMAFIEAWDRYLGVGDPPQRNNPNENGDELAKTNRYIDSDCSGLKRVINPINTGPCSAVAVSEGDTSTRERSDAEEPWLELK